MTRLIPSTSIPLLNTSVPIITGNVLLLKALKTVSRCSCSRSEWKASDLIPSFLSVLFRSFTVSFLEQKIRTLLYSPPFSRVLISFIWEIRMPAIYRDGTEEDDENYEAL